jgi:hypothetical protein
VTFQQGTTNTVASADRATELWVLDADIPNQVTVARWVLGLAGELSQLLELHEVDERGRCSVCRAAQRWGWKLPKRTACTVRSELSASVARIDLLVSWIVNQGNFVAMVGDWS